MHVSLSPRKGFSASLAWDNLHDGRHTDVVNCQKLPGLRDHLITFVEIIAVVCTGLVRYRANGVKKERANVLKEIKGGLGYIYRHSSVKVLLVVGLLTALLAMPIRLLLLIIFITLLYKQKKLRRMA